MSTFLSSIPSWIFTFFSGNFELVIGYVICVLFPIPWVNSTVIALWAKLLTTTPSTTTVEPTSVPVITITPTPIIAPVVVPPTVVPVITPVI